MGMESELSKKRPREDKMNRRDVLKGILGVGALTALNAAHALEQKTEMPSAPDGEAKEIGPHALLVSFEGKKESYAVYPLGNDTFKLAELRNTKELIVKGPLPQGGESKILEIIEVKKLA